MDSFPCIQPLSTITSTPFHDATKPNDTILRRLFKTSRPRGTELPGMWYTSAPPTLTVPHSYDATRA